MMADELPPLDIEGMDPAAATAVATKTAPLIKLRPGDEGDEDFAKVPYGHAFIDPEGNKRYKPIRAGAAGDIDYEALEEGAQFADPKGGIRTKPKYEGIDLTAQTLYDMATNDKERRNALKRSYGDKVKDDPSGGWYIEDNGVLRKPGRGIQKIPAAAAGMTFPVAGSILGALGGAAIGAGGGAVAGSEVPVAGTAVGAGAGAWYGATFGGASGAMLGQSFNDFILGLTGVYEREGLGEKVGPEIEAGLGGLAGAGVGRGIATVVPSLKTGASALSAVAPGMARKLAGITTPEAQQKLATGRQLAEQGVLVPPSTVYPELPHVSNVVEVFDPAFHLNEPLIESRTAHYEKNAGALLRDMGVKDPGSLTQPVTDVPIKKAGDMLLASASREMAESDARMQSALAQKKAAVEARAAGREPQQSTFAQTAAENRAVAQNLIDTGFKDMENDIETAVKVSKSGVNAGDLWQMIGEKFIAARKALGVRANKMYADYDAATAGHLPDIEGLPDTARAFLAQVPPDFASRYPNMVAKLRDLAGVTNDKGEFIKEPHQPTFGELHNLRSDFRHNVDWNSLTHDVREGTYKFFSNKVDQILHDDKGIPELKEGIKLLDAADKFYADNIAIFKSNQIRAVMRGLESGEPADPQNLYNVVVKSGETALTKKIKEMVGPNLWAGVEAAGTQDLLNASKTLIPDVYDAKKFANEVLARERDGALDVVYGAKAEKLREQARRIQMLAGTIPIPVRPNDTATQIIARARQAEEVAKAEAKKNPLNLLNKEMKTVTNMHNKEMQQARKARSKEKLGFLYDPTMGAIEAVDKILGKEDLILAAAAKFGEKSPEFEMLRQIWAQRFLRGSMDLNKKLAGVSEEVQQLMFPGVSGNQMRTLAKEMHFLMDMRTTRGAGSSMSAFSKVEHPVTRTALAAAGFGFGGVPGMAVGLAAPIVARVALGQYYKLVRNLGTHPVLLRWMEKGLNGTPVDREAVRQAIYGVLQKGGAIGAGVGEAAEQDIGSE